MSMSFDAFEEYLTEMSLPTVDAGHTDLCCLSEIQNVEIWLYEEVSLRNVRIVTKIERTSAVYLMKSWDL